MNYLDPLSIGFESVGTDVRIYPKAQITNPEKITLGSCTVIDDFVFVQGRGGGLIGSYVHIASFSSISGGGGFSMGDFSSISSGVRLFSGTDITDGSGLLGPMIPGEMRAVSRPGVKLEDHVFVGANSVVHPGVVIGEGAVIGSQSLVLEDIEPWTVNVGSPTRVIKKRPREKILELAQKIMK